MKSVGEAMGIGRCFNEAYGKAMRSRELDRDPREEGELVTPAWDRFDALLGRLREGEDADALSAESSVHPWFCHELARRVAREERRGRARPRAASTPRRCGCSSTRASPTRASRALCGCDETAVRARRLELGVRPVFKTVDSCGGEVAAETSYLYSSYDRIDEPLADDRPAVLILGSGPEPHRPGDRVRLLLRAGGAQLPAAGLRRGDGQLQPRDGLDRLRHGRPALLRAAHGRGRARGRRARAARRCRRAVRRADAAQARPPAGRAWACRSSARARPRSTSPRTASASATCSRELGLRAPDWAIAGDADEAVVAAERIGYPVLVRPVVRARRAGDARLLHGRRRALGAGRAQHARRPLRRGRDRGRRRRGRRRRATRSWRP